MLIYNTKDRLYVNFLFILALNFTHYFCCFCSLDGAASGTVDKLDLAFKLLALIDGFYFRVDKPLRLLLFSPMMFISLLLFDCRSGELNRYCPYSRGSGLELRFDYSL